MNKLLAKVVQFINYIEDFFIDLYGISNKNLGKKK